MISRGFVSIASSFGVYGGSVLLLFLLEVTLPTALSQTEYSSWVFWRSLLFTLAALFPLGIDQANVRLAIIQSAAVRSVLVLHWIIGGTILLAAWAMFGRGGLAGLCAIFAVVLIPILLTVGSEFRARLETVKAQIFIHGWKGLFVVLGFSWSLFLPLSNEALLSLLAGSTAVLVPFAICSFVRANLSSPAPKENRVQPKSVKGVYSISALFLMSSISLVSATYLEQILARTFADNATVASFGVHITLFFLPSSVLITFIGFMLAPYFRALSTNDSRKRLIQYLNVVLWLAPLVSVATYYIGLLIVRDIYGQQYAVQPIVAWMVLGASIFRFIYIGLSSFAGMHLNRSELRKFAVCALFGTVLQAAFIVVAAQDGVDILKALGASVFGVWLIRTGIAAYFVRRHFSLEHAA